MPVSIPGVKAPEVKKINKPTVPNKPAMSMQQLPMDKMKQMRGVGAPSRFDKNQEQRNAMKKIAFYDELEKLGAGAKILKALGRRLLNMQKMTPEAQKVVKKRTLNQLQNTQNIGNKRVMRAEDALKNPNKSMGQIAAQDKKLKAGQKLQSEAGSAHSALYNSHSAESKNLLKNIMEEAK